MKLIIKYLYLLIAIAIAILYFYNLVNPSVLYIFTLIANIILIIKTRNFKPLSILFIFLLTYTLILFPHYIQGEPIVIAYEQFRNSIFYNKTLLIHFLFLTTILVSISNINKPLIIRNYLKIRNNTFAYIICMFLSIIILLFGKTGDTIIDSGGYTKGNTGSLFGLSINEYFILFMPLMYVYSGNQRKRIFLILLLSILYSIKTLLYGGRVGVLQCLLMLYILFIDNKKLSFTQIILIAFPLIYAFIIFGIIRVDPAIINNNFSYLIKLPFRKNIFYSLLGNQNDVYYSSARLIALVKIGALDYGDRISSFIYNLIAIIIPYKLLPNIANIAGYLKDKYPAGGGGLISSYYYLFLSYPGAIIIGLYISYIFKLLIKNFKQYWILYSIMVLVTYPRWIGYNPINLFKLCMYIIPIYVGLNIISKYIKINTYK